jgi:hypothetical protein
MRDSENNATESVDIWVNRTNGQTVFLQGDVAKDFAPTTEGWNRLVLNADKTAMVIEGSNK